MYIDKILCHETKTLMSLEDFNCICLHRGWDIEEKLCSDDYSYIERTNTNYKQESNGQTTSTAFKAN